MKINSEKIVKLLIKNPYLVEILDRPLEPTRNNKGTDIDDINIQFETADCDLMWRTGDNVGLPGSYSFIFQVSGKHKNQVMRRGEYLFAVSKTDKIINMIRWPNNDDEGRGKPQIYGWEVLWGTKEGDTFYDPLYNHIKCLVWVTIETWHGDTKNDAQPGARFGELIERRVEMTVYQKPKGGFANLRENSWIGNHINLDSKVLIRAVLEKNTDIIGIGGRLDELCNLFQTEVYFNGMKTILDNGKARGASGQFGSTKVMCAEMCGYDRVMLQSPNCWISFQLRPDSKEMYVLGLNGRLPQIRGIVKDVVRLWNTDSKMRLGFKPDGDISVM